jgi:hypothetical protein
LNRTHARVKGFVGMDLGVSQEDVVIYGGLE